MTLTIPLEVHRAKMSRRARRWVMALCAVSVALTVMVIGARHDASVAKRAACAAELRELQARYPLMRLAGPVAADPCAMVRWVRG